MDTGNQFLGTERIGKLMRQYAVPCIISLLVGALYNIVDQIFIANASYLGSYGNAANTVVFPLTVVALGIAVFIGDGCCAFVSIALGRNAREDAHRSVGNAIVLCEDALFLPLKKNTSRIATTVTAATAASSSGFKFLCSCSKARLLPVRMFQTVTLHRSLRAFPPAVRSATKLRPQCARWHDRRRRG